MGGGISSGLNSANYSLSMPAASATYTAQAASGVGTSAGSAIGGAGGSLAGPVGSIIGAIAGATIGGIFDAVQGGANRKQQKEMFDTQMAMANKQFEWGQGIDRFNMQMLDRQQDETEKLNRHNITQAQVDRINTQLRQNADFQNHVRSLWGGR